MCDVRRESGSDLVSPAGLSSSTPGQGLLEPGLDVAPGEIKKQEGSVISTAPHKCS